MRLAAVCHPRQTVFLGSLLGYNRAEVGTIPARRGSLLGYNRAEVGMITAWIGSLLGYNRAKVGTIQPCRYSLFS